MQDRPTVQELLRVVRTFLEDEVVPVFDGPRRFHAVVAANVLAIVDRELEDEEASLVAEWRRLGTLLEEDDGGPPPRLAALRAAVRARTAALTERIRRGDADEGAFRDAARRHVRETVREKLRVANPRLVRSGP